MSQLHDLHEFVIASQRDIEAEYTRIRKRASEDPGTAGDQGEENWKELLKKWLPSYFHIETKGRIITASGYTSPQVDVLVLRPSYPPHLLNKKLYLSGGVVAAFECKTTLTSKDVEEAVATAAGLHGQLPKRTGSPYRELHSGIVYGLLAHSHSWKGEQSTPVENITNALYAADQTHAAHPRQCLDLLAVADLGTWTVSKMTYFGPGMKPWSEAMAKVYGAEGSASTAFTCHTAAQHGWDEWASKQKEGFSPLGTLLSALYSKLAWTFPDMRPLESYFSGVGLTGRGVGYQRRWPIEIYSGQVQTRVRLGKVGSKDYFNEWGVCFV